VTAVPKQVTKSWTEKLILPLLHLTYTAWLPLFLVGYGRNPRTVAANGQVLFLSREVCLDLGGFEGVRDEIVDDVAFCRLAKAQGQRVVFADGTDIASCRMYESASQVWAGFSKNLFEGLGGRLLPLFFVMLLYFAAFVLPYIALAALPWLDVAIFGPAASVGVGVNLLLRSSLALRFGHPVLSVLLHPIAVLGLLAIAVNSFVWSQRDSIKWAGRSYASKKNRDHSLNGPVSRSAAALPAVAPRREA
jgi:hypothetical protein